MDRLVPVKRTDCSQQELIHTFVNTWHEIFDHVPTKEQIAIVWAQHALETGMSTSMYNYNIGTIQRQYGTNEFWDNAKAKSFAFDYDSSPHWFAFDTLKEGTEFYLKFVKNIKYKAAWSALESHDFVEFTQLLKRSGYYYASEQKCVAATLTYINRFMKMDYYEQALQDLNSRIKPAPQQAVTFSFFEKIKKFIVNLFIRLFL